jgi:hypothetical protein
MCTKRDRFWYSVRSPRGGVFSETQRLPPTVILGTPLAPVLQEWTHTPSGPGYARIAAIRSRKNSID